MYSCSSSMSWKNRVVDVELQVCGLVQYLPQVQQVLTGLRAKGLKFRELCSTSLPPSLPSPSLPSLSPPPPSHSLSPSASSLQLPSSSPYSSPFQQHQPSPEQFYTYDSDETRLGTPSPGQFTPELFASPTLSHHNLTVNLSLSHPRPVSASTPLSHSSSGVTTSELFPCSSPSLHDSTRVIHAYVSSSINVIPQYCCLSFKVWKCFQ